MSKKVVYIGLERCDFIYQLAVIASLKGAVLLVDNSRTGDLFSIIGKDSDDDIVERHNMHITKNLNVKNSDTSDYEFVFIYAGMEVDREYYDEDAMVLVMPDYTDLCLRAVEVCLPGSDTDTLYIMRDFCTKKINEKGIAQRLNIPRSAIEGKIPLSLGDIAAYTAFTHNGKQSISALSDPMYTALVFTTARLHGLDEKNAGKLVGRAKKL
jgi:hypothetical protein